MHALGVPFKAVIELPVIELGRRFSAEQHAAHAARLVRRARPDVVIVGNEVNVVDRAPGVDTPAVIDRYLDRYAAMVTAIRAVSPATKIQLYGEAYYGQPADPDALLRHLLAALRRRSLPPPDLAGLHVYDHAAVIPARVEGYRRLFAEHGLRLPLAIEELGPRKGVLDTHEAARLARAAAGAAEPDAERLERLVALRADGWLTEDEHADLVVQHLATAAASADQAQIFCAIDFRAELHVRRGLLDYEWGRRRPAFHAFQFTQQLINDVEEVRLLPGAQHSGTTRVSVRRRDGIAAQLAWSVPRAGEATAAPRALPVPPYTFVCDAQGRLLLSPRPYARTTVLPGAATAECGGPVRLLL
jgi:hypothetical protein